MKKWETVEVLRYARHDWLNKIQLISGYLSMGNTDRVQEILQEIIQSAHQESSISHTLPQFASYILTYNWENNQVLLNYQVEGKGSYTKEQDKKITEWFVSFFQMINERSLIENENIIFLDCIFSGDEVRFIIEYNGILTSVEPIQKFLNETSFFHIKINTLNVKSTQIELVLS